MALVKAGGLEIVDCWWVGGWLVGWEWKLRFCWGPSHDEELVVVEALEHQYLC